MGRRVFTIKFNLLRSFIALIVLVLFMAFGCTFLNYHTVANSALIYAGIAVVVVLALLTGPLRGLWKWLSGTESDAIATGIHFIAGFAIIASAVLMANFYMTDTDSLPEQKAVVSEKIEEVHKRFVSYGRGRGGHWGAPYYTYEVKALATDGTEMRFNVRQKYFNSLREGDTLSVGMGPGKLGLTIYQLR